MLIQFHYFMCDYPVVSALSDEKSMGLADLSKINWPSIHGFVSILLVYMYILMQVLQSLDYHSFVVSESSKFTLLFKNCFWYSGPLSISYEFEDKL